MEEGYSMQCQECGKRPATLHFTKIVNGEKTEFRICESCAREKGEIIPGTTGDSPFITYCLVFWISTLEVTVRIQRLKPRRIYVAKNVE